MNRQPRELRRLAAAFWLDFRRHGRIVTAAYTFRAVAVVGGILAPWPLKLLIDHVIVTRKSFLPALMRDQVSPGVVVLVLTLGFVVITVIAAVANAIERNLSATIREKLTLQVRDRLLAHLLTLPPTIRTRHRSGELVLRIVEDSDLFVRVLTKTLPQLFQHGLALVITCAAMFWLDARLALAGVVCLLPAVVFVRRDGQRLWMASRQKRTCEGHVTGLAQEVVRGMAVIQASGDEAWTRQAFDAVNRIRVAAGRRETAVAVSLERTLQILQGLSMAVVTGGGAWLVLRHRMSLGDLTLMTAYVAQLLKPVEKLNDLAETTGRGMAGGERLLRLLEMRPLVQDRIGATPLRRSAGLVELRDVWFTYPDRGRPVLRGVTLRLRPRQLTVLVGASGAGKSTLMSLLVRLFEPTRGEILLDGIPLPSIQLASLRDQFAVLSQDTHLFAGSIREVLQPRDTTLEDATLWRALALVSLDRFVGQTPRRLDTALGEDGVNLSGGQRRRLALARAFLLNRPILLLDEPLANLDPESAAVILAAIDTLRATCTCFAVTHDQLLVDRADRVCRLVDGKLVDVVASSVRHLQAVMQ